MKFNTGAALTTAALAASAVAVNPLVDIGYSQYNGVNTGAVTQWLGIRFAAPPVGELRFKKPVDPLKTSEVQQADKVYRLTQERRIDS